MGQKVHPYIFRVGTVRWWKSNWFAEKQQYSEYLLQDVKIRKYIQKKFVEASISSIEIDRTTNGIIVAIHTAKPGMIIGRDGESLAQLNKDLSVLLQTRKIDIKVKEVKRPDLDSKVVADNIAMAIERRASYRRVAKQYLQKAMEAGAKGIKIYIGGRLNGAEIARGEFVSEGRIPLQTIRADIDYAHSEALTTYGKLGIKVWIYRGDVFNK